jgi:nitroreductase
MSTRANPEAFMEFRDLVERRVSVRQFLPDRVDPGDVREMIRIAGLAPSPNNAQPWRFIAIARPALLAEMAAAVRSRLVTLVGEAEDKEDAARRVGHRVEWFSTFFEDAPLVVAVVAEPYTAVIQGILDGSKLTGARVNALRGQPDIQSVGAAVEHLLLAATDLGYGGCWLSGPLVARPAIEQLLGIEAPDRLAAMVALGRPKLPVVQGHDRKPIDEMLRFID